MLQLVQYNLVDSALVCTVQDAPYAICCQPSNINLPTALSTMDTPAHTSASLPPNLITQNTSVVANHPGMCCGAFFRDPCPRFG